MAIMSERNKYLPSHVTQELWEAINKKCFEEGISKSLFVYETLLEKMKQEGYEFKESL